MASLVESKLLKIFALICCISMVFTFPSSTDENNDCSNYCQNNGVCVVIKNERQCYCLPGWTGKLCENQREYRPIQIDPADSMQISSARTPFCLSMPPDLCNGGLCQFDGTDVSCACPANLTGPYCEFKSPCIDYCVANQGRCSLGGTPEIPSCICNTGFTGQRCETELTTTTVTTTPGSTTTNIYCVVLKCGVGTCVYENNMARCECPQTHTGTRCQTKTGATSGPEPVTPPTVGPVVSTAPSVASGVSTAPTIGPVVTNPPSNNGNACSSNPCLNSRPCYNAGNSFYCFCGNSYTGTRCETFQG